MNRCRRSVARARELFSLPDDAPVLVEGRWVTPLPPPSWWRNKSLSGGQFVGQCTHLVDIARFVAGEIVEVSAFSAKGHIDDVEGFTADDAMVVSARFASGALGQFSTGCFPRRDFAAEGGIGMEFGSRSTRCRLLGWGMEFRAEFEAGGTETLRVTLAANESAASGKALRLG